MVEIERERDERKRTVFLLKKKEENDDMEKIRGNLGSKEWDLLPQ